MSVTIKVKDGDTWDAIAARELGNATLGREIAGFNGQNETGAPTPRTEIRIPHRGGEDQTGTAHDAERQSDREEIARLRARNAELERERSAPPADPPPA